MSIPYNGDITYSGRSDFRTKEQSYPSRPAPLQPRSSTPMPYPPPLPTEPLGPPQPPYYPPPRPINKRAVGAIVVFIIIIILLIISLFLPWYNVKGVFNGEMHGTSSGIRISADVKMEANLDMYLQEQEMNMDYEASTMGQTVSDSQTSSKDYEGDDEMKSSMDITLYLTIISIIFIIIGIIITGIISLGSISYKIGLVIGIIVVLFLLITMVYFPIGFPKALKESIEESGSKNELEQMGFKHDGSFIGSSSGSIDMAEAIPNAEGLEEAPMDVEWTWGPNLGWYLIIVSFVMSIIGVVLIATAGTHEPKTFQKTTFEYTQPGYDLLSQSPSSQQPTQPYQEYGNSSSRDKYYE